jgi:hypothetical protein
MNKNILLLVYFCGLGSIGYGQNFLGLLQSGSQTVSAGVNAAPHLNMNFDYLFAFEQKQGTLQRWGVLTQIHFPLFSQKDWDFDLRIGAGALLSFSNHLKTIAGLSWNLSRTADLNGRYFHSGWKIDVFPGYYGSKWVCAPHLSLNYQPLLHIKHSEYAKQAFQDLYPQNSGRFTSPKDGWFTAPNLILQTGIGVAYFQPRWRLDLTAGFQYQPNRFGLINLPDIGILPFYGGLNFGYSIVK